VIEPVPLHDVAPIRLTAPPRLGWIYARGALRALVRSQGALPAGASLPRVVVERGGVVVSAEQVAAFEAVCGVRGHGLLPPAMPEILFLGSMAEVALHPELPLSPLGLIHVRQQVRCFAPIRPGDPLDLRTTLWAARRTPRGVELDLWTTVDVAGRRVWDGLTTLLSRSAETRSREGARGQEATVREGFDVDVAEDVGRRYAAVSGDYNPHHLWPWSARRLGYRAPIAHGMWTLSFVLGFVEPAHLDAPVRLDAQFKRPLYLPGAMRVVVEDDHDPYLVEALDPRHGAPHLRLLVHRDLGWDGPAA
jgi:acyl dehydratase